MLSPSILRAYCPLFFFILVPSALSLYWISWIIYARHFHPLAKYPGPCLASISRLWIVLQIKNGRSEKVQRGLHAKFGPIVRIAPNEVAISDPGALRTIYAVNSGFTKTDFYTPWRPAWCKHPDNFTATDERIHSKRRKIVNGIYSMSNIVRSEKSIDSCTNTLLAKMEDVASAGTVIDIAQWSQLYAFDVIGQLFFSRMFGFLESGGDHNGYIRALEFLLPFLCAVSVMPTYARPLFLFSSAVVPKVSRALRSVREIENAARGCVVERQSRLEKGDDVDSDVLNSLFKIVQKKGPEVDFGTTEITVEVYVALFAGSDTTAAAITSILYHLMRNPGAYARLMVEIDESTRSGSLSNPVRYHEAAKLPYLAACYKEGMRLHPSVGLTVPRLVPHGGREICGHYFHGGTRVGVNAAVIHRDRAVFGHDADEFVPERWFRHDANTMDRNMFQFGGGSRTCIGKNDTQISLCEMYKMIPQLLREYHLELVDPGREWETHNYWFNKPSGVRTRLKKRVIA